LVNCVLQNATLNGILTEQVLERKHDVYTSVSDWRLYIKQVAIRRYKL